MALFNRATFVDGGWSGDLKRALAPMRILPRWTPKAHRWRGTGTQWVQFEQPGLSGPHFWMAKPAIVALPASTPAGAAGYEAHRHSSFLCVGCYVERGYEADPAMPARVMQAGWHWLGFERCLCGADVGSDLDDHLRGVPEGRRTISIWSDSASAGGERVSKGWVRHLPYYGSETLKTAWDIVRQVPRDTWVNVIVGARFGLDECCERQADMLAELRTPLVRAEAIGGVMAHSVP